MDVRIRASCVQNVAIQMGLRLQSKGGRSITNIQRSVLRCDACSQVVKSQNKMFCPACGHATLSRVSVSIGPDGAEHYGVRKRHTLKGTRCARTPPPPLPPMATSHRTCALNMEDKHRIHADSRCQSQKAVKAHPLQFSLKMCIIRRSAAPGPSPLHQSPLVTLSKT